MERGKEPWLGQPSETIAILQKYDFVFRKQFGQNFLIDTHVLDKIVDAAGITKDDFVIEIGPGIGTLTQYLAYHAREVLAVEIDHDLIPILSDTLSTYDNVHVINEDILKVDIRGMIEKYNGGKKAKVVANLPYYADHHGTSGETDTGGVHHRYGAERSGHAYAGRTGDQGLRCIVSGGAVLCKSLSGSQCPPELLYAKAESGQRSNPSDLPRGSSC